MAESIAGQGNGVVSRAVETGKDIVALLRDAALFVMAALLLLWPTQFNAILVNAGFEEGSFAGLKWKSQLKATDADLVAANATIADLKTQNDALNKALADAKSEVSNGNLKAQISALEQSNSELTVSSTKVQASVASRISDNTPYVEKAGNGSNAGATWGVVFSGDTVLDKAKYEVQTAAPKYGIPNAAIYYRQGVYRSAAIASDRGAAEQLLQRAKGRRADSYIVNMANWCPNKVDKKEYIECTPAQ
jgi:hypothetical protein